MARKILSWAAIAVIVFVANVGWNVISLDATDDPQNVAEERAEQMAWIAEDDANIAEQISAGSSHPARGWLDDPEHATFEADPRQMRSAIEAFHEAGADDVLIVEPETLGGREFADGFVVRLPPSGPARDAIFAVEAEMWGGEGTPDAGQQYLSVYLD